jgi:hypothetical protein
VDIKERDVRDHYAAQLEDKSSKGKVLPRVLGPFLLMVIITTKGNLLRLWAVGSDDNLLLF